MNTMTYNCSFRKKMLERAMSAPEGKNQDEFKRLVKREEFWALKYHPRHYYDIGFYDIGF